MRSKPNGIISARWSVKATEELSAWFLAHRRDLPWRQELADGSRDPYRVWISEIMLQQTQVEAVIAHFHAWIERFPNLLALSESAESEVLQHWQGLGYYSRARNILRTAQQIILDHEGRFPRERQALEKLPGIGAYTAGAILSLAWNLPEAILDGNLVRIFSRLLAWDFLPDTPLGKQRYWDKARQWSQSGNARLVNEALMELGALVCTPRRPRCNDCPLAEHCRTGHSGQWENYPPRKTLTREDWDGFALLLHDGAGHYLLQQNPDSEFLKGQWNFYLQNKRDSAAGKAMDAHSLAASMSGLHKNDVRFAQRTGIFVKHAITRYRITLEIIYAETDNGISRSRTRKWPAHSAWIAENDMPSLLVHSLGIKLWKAQKSVRKEQ